MLNFTNDKMLHGSPWRLRPYPPKWNRVLFLYPLPNLNDLFWTTLYIYISPIMHKKTDLNISDQLIYLSQIFMKSILISAFSESFPQEILFLHGKTMRRRLNNFFSPPSTFPSLSSLVSVSQSVARASGEGACLEKGGVETHDQDWTGIYISARHKSLSASAGRLLNFSSHTNEMIEDPRLGMESDI